MNPNRKAQAGNPVSIGMQSSTYTPFVNTHFNLPHGLFLRQTILAGTTSVTIPDGINFVYAICVGGGGGGGTLDAGGAGGIAWGWTIASPYCTVSADVGPGVSGDITRYGNVIAGGGGGAANNGFLGGASGGSPNTVPVGSTNYWGIPGGQCAYPKGLSGSGAGGGVRSGILANPGGEGGDGISGGGGGANSSTTGVPIGGNGGNGLAGGGGGCARQSSGGGVGGSGGNGINILTGQATTGGTPTVNGGGGGGVAGNGSNAGPGAGGNGGLGGGGGGAGATQSRGGAGILYLFY